MSGYWQEQVAIAEWTAILSLVGLVLIGFIALALWIDHNKER